MIRIGAGGFAASVAVLAGSCIAPTTRPATAAPAAPPVQVAPPPRVTTDHSIWVHGPRTQGAVVLGNLARGVTGLTLDGQPVRVAADGLFVIAFGQDAGPEAVLRARRSDGTLSELRLQIEPRAWRVETIAGLPRFAQPSTEFARRRPPELAQINAARRIDGGAGGWRQRFIWPVRGRISGLFGSSRVYANGEKGAPHSGVDVARATGTPVIAPADGVVTLAAAQPFTLEGKILILDHGMGLNSAFLHLSRHDVKPGDRVRQGQLIGAVGMTGRASGPHLHWGMKWLDRRIDPLLLAGPMPG